MSYISDVSAHLCVHFVPGLRFNLLRRVVAKDLLILRLYLDACFPQFMMFLGEIDWIPVSQ